MKLDRYDSNTASKWLAKAEAFFPYDKQVIEFKEKLFDTLERASTQSNSWELFLLKGLVISLLLKIIFLHKKKLSLYCIVSKLLQ